MWGLRAGCSHPTGVESGPLWDPADPRRGGACGQAVKGWEQGSVIHPSPPAAPPHHADVPGGDSRGPGAQAAGGKAGTVPLCIPTEPAGLRVTCPFPVSLCSGKDRGEPQALCCGRGPAQAGEAEGSVGHGAAPLSCSIPAVPVHPAAATPHSGSCWHWPENPRAGTLCCLPVPRGLRRGCGCRVCQARGEAHPD